MSHEIELRALGDFKPTEDLIIFVGDYLESQPGIFDAIVTANVASGTVDVSVEVEARSATAAHSLATAALGEALQAAGAEPVKSFETVVAFI